MQNTGIRRLRLAALSFLSPGLAGMITASIISGNYLDKLPRMPDPPAMRMTPRQIHEVIIYQTAEEDRRLAIIEYSSTALFFVGLGVSLVYLNERGIGCD